MIEQKTQIFETYRRLMTNDRQFVANLPFLHIQNKNRVPNSFLLYICTLYFANLLKTNHGQHKDCW